MRSVYGCLSLILVTACASHRSPSNANTSATSDSAPELILRRTSWEDPELAAKGIGRMEVAVRVADRPGRPVTQALVSIKIGGDGAPSKQKATNEKGVVEFDSKAVGQ